MNTEELKRLAEAATPGPWQSGGDWIEVCDETAFDDGVLISISNSNSRACWDDLAYIAAANPAAVLELIRQRDELLAALSIFMEVIDRPPEASCSCHISPPCNDCVENFGLREAFSFADTTIARAESKS